METYIPKSSIQTVQRNLINTVRQNKQQLGFTDNRPVTTSQRKMLQNMGQQKTVQMYKVKTDMVEGDLLNSSSMRQRFFRMNTRTKLREVTSYSIDERFLPVNYEHLDGNYINTKAKLQNWLSGDGEKIYVWQGGFLTGGNNPGGAGKVCHPNLLGGDPDVDYAGTLEPQDEDNWYITKYSGHFQPKFNAGIQADIAKYLNDLPGDEIVPVILPQ